MGDFPSHLVQAPVRPRPRRGRAAAILAATVAMCLPLTGATASPPVPSPASATAGMDRIPGPPAGPSWAPATRQVGGLNVLATAGDGPFTLHTAGG